MSQPPLSPIYPICLLLNKVYARKNLKMSGSQNFDQNKKKKKSSVSQKNLSVERLIVFG